MIKKIATIGLILLMLGVAMGLAGFMTIDKAPTNTQLEPVKAGEYRTSRMYYVTGDVIIIANPGNDSGLIKYSQLLYVTSKNISQNAIKPSRSVTGGLEYSNLNSGTYVFVVFNSSKPSNMGFSLESSSEYRDIMIAYYAMISGVFIFIAGIIIIIIGLILKPKKKVPLKTVIRKNK